jgi:hypothetical protein
VLTVKELEQITFTLKPSEFRKQLGPFVLIQRPPDIHRRAVPLEENPQDTLESNLFDDVPRTTTVDVSSISGNTLGLLFQFDSLVVATLPPLQGIDEISVGRLPDCDLVVDDPSVSKRHALIRWDAANSHATVHDVGSTNGTYINAGNRLAGETALQDGDIVSFGDVQFWFLLTATLHTRLQKKGSSHRSV